MFRTCFAAVLALLAATQYVALPRPMFVDSDSLAIIRAGDGVCESSTPVGNTCTTCSPYGTSGWYVKCTEPVDNSSACSGFQPGPCEQCTSWLAGCDGNQFYYLTPGCTDTGFGEGTCGVNYSASSTSSCSGTCI